MNADKYLKERKTILVLLGRKLNIVRANVLAKNFQKFNLKSLKMKPNIHDGRAMAWGIMGYTIGLQSIMDSQKNAKFAG